MSRHENSPFSQSRDGAEQPLRPTEDDLGTPASPETIESPGIGEKIIDYLKYKKLKVKEYVGRLSQEDLDRLLEYDFQEQIKDSPPINGTFSPREELAKIREEPKEFRKEALGVFKENLNRQREALATLRVFIERSIESNNDIPRENLIGLLEEFGAFYGFDDRQKRIVEQTIDGYYQQRQKAIEVRKQFPNDYQLVDRLTGVRIEKGQLLSVSVGSMTIDIKTDGFNTGRLYQGAGGRIVSSHIGGFAGQSPDDDPVYYIVIDQDRYRWKRELEIEDLITGRSVRKHEYEHQKNRLFRSLFGHREAPKELWGYEEEPDPEIKKVRLEAFLDESRQTALEQAEDEITACLRDRSLSDLRVQLDGLFFAQDGSPYDYLVGQRNWKLFENDPLYQEAVQKILVREYKTIIEKAVDSYSELVTKGEYSTSEAIALLTDKPLEEWPKTIRRLLA